MKEMVCIVCPNGCDLQVELKEGQWRVTGNRCKRGETFAVAEMTNPKRTMSSTVATVFEEVPVIPVRVSGEIPKARIFDVMKEINKLVVKERVARGDVLIENVLNLGVDIIVTSSVLTEQTERVAQNE